MSIGHACNILHLVTLVQVAENLALDLKIINIYDRLSSITLDLDQLLNDEQFTPEINTLMHHTPQADPTEQDRCSVCGIDEHFCTCSHPERPTS